jgi:competence protein ComEC
LELPDGRTLLYDAGHMGSPLSATQAIAPVLWSRGITHLDAVIISHADADHYNALPELLDRFHVGVVYVSPVMFRDEQPGVSLLRAKIEKHQVPIRFLYAGKTLRLGDGVESEVLHPSRRGGAGSDNSNSIVLALDYAGERLLLPGDLEPPGLDDVLAEEPLDCSIVMAPHHGSARSRPRGFAEWSRPEWVVISGSRSRDASEVTDAYRSYGADVLHTAHDGAIRFIISPAGTTVETWHDGAWHERKHRGN